MHEPAASWPWGHSRLKELEGILTTLLATGATLPEAVALLGPELHPSHRDFGLMKLKEWIHASSTREDLGREAAILMSLQPFGQAFLDEACRDWENLLVGNLPLSNQAGMRFLPKGLHVVGDLLMDSTNIQELPDGLRVGRELFASNSAIRRLPENLQVGGGLWLEHCPFWDGVIPASAQIQGKIATDSFPAIRGGIPLADWRAMHPAQSV